MTKIKRGRGRVITNFKSSQNVTICLGRFGSVGGRGRDLINEQTKSNNVVATPPHSFDQLRWGMITVLAEQNDEPNSCRLKPSSRFRIDPPHTIRRTKLDFFYIVIVGSFCFPSFITI